MLNTFNKQNGLVVDYNSILSTQAQYNMIVYTLTALEASNSIWIHITMYFAKKHLYKRLL